MPILRLITILGGLTLAITIFWAMSADPRGLGPVLTEMFTEPWSVVTLIDLYLGFLIAAVVMVSFEKSWPARLFWAAPVLVLGNIWTALWFAIRLPEITKRLRRGR